MYELGMGTTNQTHVLAPETPAPVAASSSFVEEGGPLAQSYGKADKVAPPLENPIWVSISDKLEARYDGAQVLVRSQKESAAETCLSKEAVAAIQNLFPEPKITVTVR